MFNILVGIFLGLHGMVHLLYAGQSGHLFELRPGMTWPDGSWAFSRSLGDETTRVLGIILLVLAALGLFAGGLGVIVRQDWPRPVVTGAVLFSALVFLLLWNGKLHALSDQGWVGILIDLGILVAAAIVKRPA